MNDYTRITAIDFLMRVHLSTTNITRNFSLTTVVYLLSRKIASSHWTRHRVLQH